MYDGTWFCAKLGIRDQAEEFKILERGTARFEQSDQDKSHGVMMHILRIESFTSATTENGYSECPMHRSQVDN